ncbi:MAG: glycosyltransferase family 9 protein [bacterium]|nr:glycosyltransferase family 9 protein [bacterium]
MYLKAKNILFACCAMAFLLFRRRVHGLPQRILIVQNAKLGDMVCTTPLFRAIKKTYPSTHLTVMGNVINKELLAGHPYVDEYIVAPQGFVALVRELRREKFDFATTVGPDLQALCALMCARIPHVVVPRIVGGHSPYETSVYKFLSRFVTTANYHMRSYMPREYLKLLEPLDIRTNDARKELAVADSAVLRVKELLAQKGYNPEKDLIVGIAPSAGAHKIKSWGAERFARAAEYLAHKHNAVIAIIAAKGEKDDVEKMISALPASVRSIDLCGALSIEELKAVVSLLSLYISSDTGPIHIAEAFDTPSVDVLGAVDEHEISIASPRHRVVFHPKRGEPALHVMSASVYDPAEVRRQTDMVTVEMVVKEIEGALND